MADAREKRRQKEAESKKRKIDAVQAKQRKAAAAVKKVRLELTESVSPLFVKPRSSWRRVLDVSTASTRDNGEKWRQKEVESKKRKIDAVQSKQRKAAAAVKKVRLELT